jgi:Rhamnan synthesis protein F
MGGPVLLVHMADFTAERAREFERMNRPEPERFAASLDGDVSGAPISACGEAPTVPRNAANERDFELAALYARVSRLEYESEFYRQQLRALIRSLSWRITRPLRLLSSLLRRKSPPVRFSWAPGETTSREYFQFGGSSEDLRILRQYAEDLVTLRDDPQFDPGLSLPLEWTRTGAIVAFLEQWSAHESRLPSAGLVLRRPCAGFHPQIYAHAHAGTYDTTAVNPLAHFIRSGRPDGPWRHDVITPTSATRAPAAHNVPPTALHAHFHYPELGKDLIRRITPRGARCDLLLSTDEARKGEVLREAASGYRRGDVNIRIFPNRGRDIGAFLTGFGAEIVARYEIIGHVHGKRSLHGGGRDPFFGERWRDFLWQNLIGGRDGSMDTVLAHLAGDAKLGLIFPEDPYLHGWDGNGAAAEKLAARMGMTDPLPPYFDFPTGTMFWARTAALKPLFALGLGWDDYPREPAANDGTILNAIERLLPFVAAHAGYRFATTYVPGVTR